MATYFRPNITDDQRLLLIDLLTHQLEGLAIEDKEFENHYVLYLKLRDCREISTDKKD